MSQREYSDKKVSLRCWQGASLRARRERAVDLE